MVGSGGVLIPQGKAVKRITIEIDVKGQIQLSASQETMAGPGPIPALEIAILLQQLSLNIMTQFRTPKKGSSDGEKTS